MEQIKETKIAHKIAANTAFQIVGKIVSMSITILATVVITRMYGREGYGEFNLMQNFPGLFFIIVDFGINAIATKELSEKWENAEHYLGNILILRIGMSALIMMLAAATLMFFPYSPQLKFGIYLCLFLILTQALYATTNIVFQVKLRYDLSTIGYIIGSVAILILVVVLSYLKVSVTWVSFSYVIGGLITFLVNLYFIKKLNLNIKISVDKTLWKYLFVQSFPLGLMFIFSQINFKADSIMISVLRLPSSLHLSNTESVAVYGLPYKIFEVTLVIPTFFMNAVYPVLIRHMLQGKKKLQNTFMKSLLALFSFGLVSGLLGFVFAPLAIRFLGGSQFTQSIDVLRILMGGLFVFYLTQPLAWLIVTLEKQIYLPYIYLASAVFNVAANYVFIPRYSFYASAYITWISEFLILIMITAAAIKAWKSKYA
ncbi:MAG TPA: flippase [Candidatus Saccharimonadales bacterium]|nr:flippase [Candidatus Saccharimonadales bacterium]